MNGPAVFRLAAAFPTLPAPPVRFAAFPAVVVVLGGGGSREGWMATAESSPYVRETVLIRGILRTSFQLFPLFSDHHPSTIQYPYNCVD